MSHEYRVFELFNCLHSRQKCAKWMEKDPLRLQNGLNLLCRV